MKLDLSGKEFTEKIRQLTNDENKKEKVLYGDIERAIRSLNINLSKNYDFKQNVNVTKGTNSKIMIPFEVSNLFASFVSLKRQFKTFDLISRRDDDMYQYNGSKHPQQVSNDNINNVDISEVINFTNCILQHMKNFSVIEKFVFSQYLHDEGVISSFDKYDDIIMLENQFVYFIQAVYENYSYVSEMQIEEMRLKIKTCTERIVCGEKEEDILVSNKFNNIYMRAYDCYSKAIDHILSETHDENGKRKPISDFIDEKDILKNGEFINLFNSAINGRTLSEEKVINLKNKLEELYEDNIMVKNQFCQYNEQRGVFYNSSSLFKELSDIIFDLMEIDYDCLFEEKPISEKFKRHNEGIKVIICLAEWCGIRREIEDILNGFYDALDSDDLPHKYKYDFLNEQDEIIEKKISDLKMRYDSDMNLYKENLKKGRNVKMTEYFNKGIELALSDLTKKEADNKILK